MHEHGAHDAGCAAGGVAGVDWQAVVAAFMVSSVVALAYLPHIVLKLGLGFNASLLSTFLGALFLHVAPRLGRAAGIAL